MTILDIVSYFIVSIFLILLGILSIILEFDTSLALNIYKYMENKYLLLIVGVVIILMGLKILSSIFTRNKRNDAYITRRTDFGEIKISMKTIVGLVKATCKGNEDLTDINVGVKILEDSLYIEIHGETKANINIPDMTAKLQEDVKNDIEKSTGIIVKEIKIYITNVSHTERTLR